MEDLYFKTIFNPKIENIARRIRVDGRFTVEEIIRNNPLWIVEDHTLAWRCYPLFNTDKIMVSDSRIKTIDNQVVIIPKTMNLMDYIIVTSDNMGFKYNTLSLYAYTYYPYNISGLNTGVTVFCSISDGYANPLPQESVLLQTSTDGEVFTTISSIQSDTDGTARYTFHNLTDTLYVRFTNLEESIQSNTIQLGVMEKYPTRMTITGE